MGIRKSMDIESNLENFAITIAEAIFSDQSEVELEGNFFPINSFKSSKLRYVDLYGYRFIEQNPIKSSRWAEMARNGHKILWIFKGNTYYARVVDGKFTLLKR